MAKRISKVTFSGNFDESQGGAEKYFVQDIEQLQQQGAQDLVQVYASYDNREVVKGIIGVCRGSLMTGPYERIALPCPPYCHPNAKNEEQEIGALSFQEARQMITG
ncbi:MAG: hypothetical protein AAF990_14275 [Bacteroidota bacterium]